MYKLSKKIHVRHYITRTCIYIFILIVLSLSPSYALAPFHERGPIYLTKIAKDNSQNQIILSGLTSHLAEEIDSNSLNRTKTAILDFYNTCYNSEINGLIPQILFKTFNKLSEKERATFNQAILELYLHFSLKEYIKKIKANKKPISVTEIPEQNKPLFINLNPAIDISIDLSIHPKQHPPIHIYAGGRAANAARGLSKLGKSSVLYTPLFGKTKDLYLALLSNPDITIIDSCLDFKDNKMTRINIHYTEKGKEFRFDLEGPVLTRANLIKIKDDIKKLLHKVKNIVISGTVPPGTPDNFLRNIIDESSPDTTNQLFLDIKGNALLELSNTNPYVIKINLLEFSELSKISYKKLSRDRNLLINTAINMIVQNKVQNLIITLGRDGAIFVNKDKVIECHPPEKNEIKSPVGSGDSLLSGILSRLIEEHEPDKVLQYGVAFGTASAKYKGSGLATKKEVDQYTKNVITLSSNYGLFTDNLPQIYSDACRYMPPELIEKYIYSVSQGFRPIWVSDMDETLTHNTDEPISYKMARDIIEYLKKGGLFVLITGNNLGNPEQWLKKTSEQSGIIKQFLEPLYKAMTELSQEEKEKLLSQILLQHDTGAEILFINTISDKKITFKAIYQTPKLMTTAPFFKEAKNSILKIISEILGISEDTKHLLAQNIDINHIFEIPLKDQLSWEIPLLIVMLKLSNTTFWDNYNKDEWFSFIKTIFNEELIQKLFIDQKDLLLRIEKVQKLSNKDVYLYAHILKKDLMKNLQARFGKLSDISIRDSQIAIRIIGLRYPSAEIKNTYNYINSVLPDRYNIKKQFVKLFKQELLKLKSGQTIKDQYAKEVLDSLTCKMTVSSIDIGPITKGTAIKNLKKIPIILNNPQKTLNNEWNMKSLNKWIKILQRHGTYNKWTEKMLIFFSGDSMHDINANDSDAIPESDIILNVNRFHPISSYLRESNKDKIFVEPVPGANRGVQFLIEKIIPYIAYFHGDKYSIKIKNLYLKNKLFQKAA